MKRKILYLSPSHCYYGAERCLVELIAHLDKNNFDPFVIVSTGCQYQREFTRLGIPVKELNIVIPFKFSNIIQMFRVNAELIKFIIKKRINLVHINFDLWYDHSLFPFFLFLKMFRVPWVYHIRFHELFSAIKRFILCQGIVVCVSEAIRKQFLVKRRSDFIVRPNLKRVITIYDGKDLTPFLNEVSILELKHEYGITGERIVGIVGAIDERKRQDLFLRVAEIVAKNIPDVKFFIIGDTYMNEPKKITYKDNLFKLRKDLGLDGRVIFTGYRNDVYKFLHLIDVFVLTSLRDPFPGTIIEAMAAAKPVVASAVDGVVEMVDNAQTGFLVYSNDPKEYAANITQLLSDDDLRRKMGESGRIKASSLYTIKKHVCAMEALYNQLI